MYGCLSLYLSASNMWRRDWNAECVCCGQASHQHAGRAAHVGDAGAHLPRRWNTQVPAHQFDLHLWKMSLVEYGVAEQKWTLVNWSAYKNYTFMEKCFCGLRFIEPPLQLNKVLLKGYKSIMSTVFMLHINQIMFDLSFSPRETGQWKAHANSAGKVKIRLNRRLTRLLVPPCDEDSLL